VRTLWEPLRETGFTRCYLKAGKSGKLCLIPKGARELHGKLKGYRYLASNPQVRMLVERSRASVSRSTVVLTIITTLSWDIVGGVLDHRTLTEIGVDCTVDLAVAAAGAAAGYGGVLLSFSMAGTAVTPVVGTAIGPITGYATCVYLDYEVSRSGLKRELVDAVERAADRLWNSKTRDGFRIGDVLSGKAIRNWMDALSAPDWLETLDGW
jgi:hypothetical protein